MSYWGLRDAPDEERSCPEVCCRSLVAAVRHCRLRQERLQARPCDQAESGGEMVLIPAGTFTMGDGAGRPDETPHTVSVSSFYLDKYPVTQELYEKVMGVNPSKQKDKKNPVERTQWTDAVRFCNKCSELEGLTPCYDLDTWECNFDANGYRLPTEAEWEYACRAGSTGKYCFGDDEAELPQYAWLKPHSQGKPQPVGQKQPNRWGLYDMHGNVWQWCNDWYGETYYAESPEENPRGPASGQDARAARRRLGLHGREVPVGLPPQGISRLLRRLLRRRQLRLPAGAEGRCRRQTHGGRRRSEDHSRADRQPKQADGCPLPAQSGAGIGQDRPGQPQGHDRFRQRSQRHPENLEHARQRQGCQTAHQGHRPRRRSAFSPDGKRILYTTLRGGFPEVWLMNRDGSEPKFVTKGSQASWAPDGKSIIFIQDNQTFVRDLASGKERRVTPKDWERCGVPAFSSGRQALRRRQPAPGEHRHLHPQPGRQGERAAQGRRGLLHAAVVEGRQEDPLPDGPGPHSPGRRGRQELGTVDLRRRRAARRPLLAGRDHDPVLPGTRAGRALADLPEKTGRRRRGVRADHQGRVEFAAGLAPFGRMRGPDLL